MTMASFFLNFLQNISNVIILVLPILPFLFPYLAQEIANYPTRWQIWIKNAYIVLNVSLAIYLGKNHNQKIYLKIV